MADLSLIENNELNELMKKSARGLHYQEDIFSAGFNYPPGSETKEILLSLFEQMKNDCEGHKAYARFLKKNRLTEEIKNILILGQIINQLKALEKESAYKMLMLHIPASDFFEIINADYSCEYLFYKLVRQQGQPSINNKEGGICFYFIINKRNDSVYFLNTVFN